MNTFNIREIIKNITEPNRKETYATNVQHKENAIKKLNYGEVQDVIFKDRLTTENLNPTNIHQVIGTSEGMSWGYIGQGPTDFAINTLLHFSKGDLEFVKNYGYDFLTDVVAHLPQGSGVLPAGIILSWMKPRMSGLLKPVLGTCDYLDVHDEYESREKEFIKSA